jgi:hypothetical protein
MSPVHLREREQAIARRRRTTETVLPAPRADLRQLAGNRAVAGLMRQPAPAGLADPIAVQERIAALRKVVQTHKAKPGKEGIVERLTREAELHLYQDEMEKYNQLMRMISRLLQMRHEMMKSVVQNLRA